MARIYEDVEIHSGKRVKNPFARKFRKMFALKGKLQLRYAKEIYLDGDRCYGVCYTSHPETKKDIFHHILIMSLALNQKSEDYLSTLLHEYVHAWQSENGYKQGHGEKSMFKAWQRWIYSELGIWI